MSKIFINTMNLDDKIIRRDFVTKILINLIIKLDLNITPRWKHMMNILKKKKLLQVKITIIQMMTIK